MIGSFAEYLNVREELIACFEVPHDFYTGLLTTWHKTQLFYWERDCGYGNYTSCIMDEWQQLLGVNLHEILWIIRLEKEIKRYKKMSTKRLVGVLNSTRRDNIIHMAVKRLLEDRPRFLTNKNEKKAKIQARKKANKGQRKTGYRARRRK